MNNRWLAFCLVCLGLSAAAVGCDEEGMIVLMDGGTSECEDGGAAACFCKNGEWRCYGDEFQICLEQTWNKLETCESGKCVGKKDAGKLIACDCDPQIMCSDDGDNNACTENKYEYGVNNNGSPMSLLYYSKGIKKCPGNAICSAGRCLSSNECNTPMPQDGEKWKCEDNIWVHDDSCDVEKDKSTCVDGKYKACIGGEWQVEDCNGERQCKDNKCIECDDEIGCGQGYLCKDNVCMETECDVSDALKCVGETIWNCQNGKWVSEEDCSERILVCENGACVMCHNGDTRCNPDNPSIFQLCENNKWHEVVNCGDKLCDGERVGDNQYKACNCKSGDVGTGKNGYCFYECGAGVMEYHGIKYRNNWVGFMCEDGYVCENDKCTFKVCQEGDYKCEVNVLMKCANGIWGLERICRAEEICDAESGSCGECISGEYRCEGDYGPDRKKCINGRWSDSDGKEIVRCGGDDICSEDDGGACISGALKCEKDTYICKSRTEVMKCEQGRWKASNHCNGTNEVCGQKGNDAKCVNMITGGGTWECDDKFKEYVRCDQDNKSNTDGKEIRKCDHNRKWMKSDSCDGKTCGYRNKQIQCVEKNIEGCIEYSYTCGENGKKIKFCINNELRDFADCSSVGLTCIDDGKGQAHCGKIN